MKNHKRILMDRLRRSLASQNFFFEAYFNMSGWMCLQIQQDITQTMTEPIVLPDGTWNCIPSTDRTTVHSDSATEFTSVFPSYIPKKGKECLDCNPFRKACSGI